MSSRLIYRFTHVLNAGRGGFHCHPTCPLTQSCILCGVGKGIVLIVIDFVIKQLLKEKYSPAAVQMEKFLTRIQILSSKFRLLSVLCNNVILAPLQQFCTLPHSAKLLLQHCDILWAQR